MTYEIFAYCDSCGGFKPCRLTDCADDICAFCSDCDEEAGGDAAAAVEARFEDAYPDLSIKRRRALDLPPGNDEEQSLDTKPELFPLGRIVATPGALEVLAAASVDSAALLARHAVGDWGELSEADWQENEFSLNNGFRLLSSYRLPDGTKVWLITEADRSATTLLLPSEY